MCFTCHTQCQRWSTTNWLLKWARQFFNRGWVVVPKGILRLRVIRAMESSPRSPTTSPPVPPLIMLCLPEKNLRNSPQLIGKLLEPWLLLICILKPKHFHSQLFGILKLDDPANKKFKATLQKVGASFCAMLFRFTTVFIAGNQSFWSCLTESLAIAWKIGTKFVQFSCLKLEDEEYRLQNLLSFRSLQPFYGLLF